MTESIMLKAKKFLISVNFPFNRKTFISIDIQINRFLQLSHQQSNLTPVTVPFIRVISEILPDRGKTFKQPPLNYYCSGSLKALFGRATCLQAFFLYWNSKEALEISLMFQTHLFQSFKINSLFLADCWPTCIINLTYLSF